LRNDSLYAVAGRRRYRDDTVWSGGPRGVDMEDSIVGERKTGILGRSQKLLTNGKNRVKVEPTAGTATRTALIEFSSAQRAGWTRIRNSNKTPAQQRAVTTLLPYFSDQTRSRFIQTSLLRLSTGEYYAGPHFSTHYYKPSYNLLGLLCSMKKRQVRNDC
jgi:hypothetical protein